MKNKKVFVLLGGIDYEGYQLLGVFSSYKKAEANQTGGYDSYDIRHWNINGDEVKQRVKKLSKKERDEFIKNIGLGSSISEQAERNLLFLQTWLPETLLKEFNQGGNDERSVATGDASSNSADTIEKENYEYERGNE